jgi:hypothetical protein
MPFVFYIFLVIVLTRLSFAVRSIVLHRKNNNVIHSALATLRLRNPTKSSGG